MAQPERSGKGELWWEAKFGNVHCIKEIVWYGYQTNTLRDKLVYICSDEKCSTKDCPDSDETCKNFEVEVKTSEISNTANLPTDITSCIYGDSVRITQRDESSESFSIREISIAKSGQILFLY